MVPAGRFAAVCGAALAMAAALVTVGLWHRPEAVVRRVPVNVEVRNVRPLNEPQAHALIPRLVKSELSAQDERSLMWHMLICPGCFNRYYQLAHRGGDGPVSRLRSPFRLVSR